MSGPVTEGSAVACQGRDGDRYRMLDSLLDRPLLEGRDYTQRHVVTALAVAPSGRLQTGVWESFSHLRDCSAELDAFRKRMRELDSP